MFRAHVITEGRECLRSLTASSTRPLGQPLRDLVVNIGDVLNKGDAG